MPVDLNEILALNTRLESLCIRRDSFVSGDLSKLPPSADIHYPSLKSLRLYKCYTDISLLLYIRSRFVNLEELSFANVGIDLNRTGVPEDIARKVADNFATYPVERYNLDYYYKNAFYCNISILDNLLKVPTRTIICKLKEQSIGEEQRQEPPQDDFMDEFFENMNLNDLEFM